MARLLTAGAEGGHVHVDGLVVGTGTVSAVTGQAASGQYAYDCNAGAGNAAAWFRGDWTGVSGRTYFLRFRFKVSALPATTSEICQFHQNGGGNLVNVVLTSGGKIQLWKGDRSAQIGSDSAATIATDTYYTSRIALTIGAGAVDSVELRLDGVTVASASSQSFSDTAPGRFQVGWLQTAPGANKHIYIDDIAVNDDQGANENTWPDFNGKIVVLLPVSISAKGSWTGGAGGTTDANMLTAVTTRPPAGTASETDTTQIESATTTVGSEIDFVTGTYTAAGIGASDTITLLYSVVEHGEDIATGTKLQASYPQSNPNGSAGATDYNAGNDVGALGTYPTNWAVHASDPVYAPSVTLGTGVTLAIFDDDASSRVQSVCFAAVMVEYVPASTVPKAANDSATLRGGRWTPSQLAASVLKRWFAADRHDNQIDGTQQSAWTDSSSWAHNATAAGSDGTSKPTLETNELNGLPAMHFGGTVGTWFDCGTADLPSGDQFVVIWVGKQDSVPAKDDWWTVNNPSGANDSAFCTTTAGGNAQSFTHFSQPGDVEHNIEYATIADSNWHIHVNAFNHNASWGALDGAVVTDDPDMTGASIATGLTIGIDTDLLSFRLDGKITEFIVLDGAVLATVQQVEGYLAGKYGLTLDAGHPYASAAPVVGSPLDAARISQTAADSRALSVSDAASLTATLTASDSKALSASETAAASATTSASDSAALSAAETAVLSLAATDSAALAAAETATLRQTATDSATLSAAEAVTVSQTVADSASLTATEGASTDTGGPTPIAANDSASLSATETATIQVSAADTATLRANAWTPADVPSLRGIFIAENITGSDNDPVATWPDTSGAGNDATASGSEQPTLKRAVLNGKDGVRFDGIDDKLTTNVDGSSLDETILAVVSTDVNSNNTILGSTLHSGRQFRFSGLNVGFAVQHVGYFATSTAALSGTGVPAIVGGRLTATTYDLSVNGTRNNGTHGATFAAGAGSIFARDHATFDIHDGDIYCLIDAAACSDADFQRLEGWAAHYFGLTADLPAGHPYKTSPPPGAETVSLVITAADSASLSANETAGTDTGQVPISGNDSATLTAAEGASLTAGVPATDSAALTAAETATLAQPAADTAALSAADSASTTAATQASDSGSLSAAETAAVSQTAAETRTISVSETATLAVASAAADSRALSAAEAAAIAQTAADSRTLSVSESAASSIGVPVSDSAGLTAAETVALSQAATDSRALSVVETAVLAQSAADTKALSVAETAVLSQAAGDNKALSAAEGASLSATLAAADSATITAAESATISQTATDTASLAISENASQEETTPPSDVAANDSATLTKTETATIGQTAADSKALSAAEQGSVSAASAAADSAALGAGESAALAASAAAGDSQALSATESATLAGAAADSKGLGVNEAASVVAVLTVSETAPLMSADAIAAITAGVILTDVTTLAASETVGIARSLSVSDIAMLMALDAGSVQFGQTVFPIPSLIALAPSSIGLGLAPAPVRQAVAPRPTSNGRGLGDIFAGIAPGLPEKGTI